jgi:hypothetical protein
VLELPQLAAQQERQQVVPELLQLAEQQLPLSAQTLEPVACLPLELMMLELMMLELMMLEQLPLVTLLMVKLLHRLRAF